MLQPTQYIFTNIFSVLSLEQPIIIIIQQAKHTNTSNQNHECTLEATLLIINHMHQSIHHPSFQGGLSGGTELINMPTNHSYD